MNNSRQVETMDPNCKTVNVWDVPNHITLDRVILKQNDKAFRALYLISTHPLKATDES